MAHSSVDVKTQKTTRDLLAAFAGNQRIIKLFENLALDVSTTIPDAMDELQTDAETARALATIAQAIASEALELAGFALNTPVVQQTEAHPGVSEKVQQGQQQDILPDLVAQPPTGLFQTRDERDESGGYVGKTLEKINFWNAARTFVSFLVNAATAARTYTFPDKDGTVAMVSDLAAVNAITPTGGTLALTGKLTATGMIKSSGDAIVSISPLTGSWTGGGVFLSYEVTYGRLEAYDTTAGAWKDIKVSPNGGNVYLSNVVTVTRSGGIAVAGEVSATTLKFGTAAASVATPSTHKMAVKAADGTTYYLLATT